MRLDKQITVLHNPAHESNYELFLPYHRKVSTCISPNNYFEILQQYNKEESDVKSVRKDRYKVSRFGSRKSLIIESYPKELFTGAAAYCSCLGKKCIIDIDVSTSKTIIKIRKKGFTSHELTVVVFGIEIQK
ncbi:hypothetical protein TrispH2_011199 [Trichoplax sp. H2]|nr:hypothetical protein TrispH2_011199 [Trichoplax sp. H2]|eukprot:RDD36535.1 hypothetical protein TrispH2_011199 [Trichoplax sp. H2]